ncbi:L-threonylcarbamoyladenylate synthase [Butyrivibrio hungatei DSM 14810]|uniref:Threonylcarbamoyl-AMP synthase n=1 Tax=Butyrivibrio hungatei DSM 14810 TaxID=1121132 RepID=A0A1M7SVE9_9FIRM|nr:L-threonylcarbamoyladenylate synthase [Butyrivibrio hungatei]SHN62411.1 L-threonylcarbamoyladenylate synthase [Butyrivibrio hungatei DSM 14810]
METEVLVVKENNIDDKALEGIKRAGEIIKKGGLVAFPTETVYGLGGDGLNPESSKKIYAAKGRPSDNPLIVHVSNMEDVKDIVKEVPENAIKLANAFWPGPLTMIMNKNDRVPYETTGGLDTVAIRMPNNKIALALIEASGGYIAAPSANISGRPSPTLAKYCEEDLSGKIEMIIDGGQVGIGLESTIVDLTSEIPMILRPGYITAEMLKDVLGEISIDKTIIDSSSTERPKAPGMKYRHYAPKGELTIIQGDQDKVVSFINSKAKEVKAAGKKVGVIGTDATKGLYEADVVKSVGNREDESTIAHELFKVLREFDDEQIDIMYSESFDDSGIGQAIMNRLLKAAGHNVITL